MTEIAIVGNAPCGTDRAAAIDQADIVVRFNNAFGYGTLRGSKIDDLFLVNRGGQPLEWLGSSEFWQRDYVRRTPRVSLPFPAASVDRIKPSGCAQSPDVDEQDFTLPLRLRFETMGKGIFILPSETIHRAREILTEGERDQRSVAPSTGFLAILSYLNRSPTGCSVHLYGFGFAGWEGHAWTGERHWVEQRHAKGDLIFHPASKTD